MATHKTRKMAVVEAKLGQPLEVVLPEMVTDQGLSATAEALGVSKATLGYWLLKLRINVRRVALAPGETLKVERNASNGQSPSPQAKPTLTDEEAAQLSTTT